MSEFLLGQISLDNMFAKKDALFTVLDWNISSKYRNAIAYGLYIIIQQD